MNGINVGVRHAKIMKSTMGMGSTMGVRSTMGVGSKRKKINQSLRKENTLKKLRSNNFLTSLCCREARRIWAIDTT